MPTRPPRTFLLMLLCCLLGTACVRIPHQTRIPSGTDLTIRRIHTLQGIPMCPAPVASKLTYAYIHVQDGEYASTGSMVPPHAADTERSRDIIRGHPEIARMVYEQFDLPRFLELGLDQRGPEHSAAAEDVDGETIRWLKGDDRAGVLFSTLSTTETARSVLGPWLSNQGELVGHNAEPDTELQVVVLAQHGAVNKFLNNVEELNVVVTAFTPSGKPLQAGRSYQDPAIFSYALPNRSLERLHKARKRSDEFSLAPVHHLAAILALDAMFEICIAEHIRSGNLTVADFPLPQTRETGTQDTDSTVILPAGS